MKKRQGPILCFVEMGTSGGISSSSLEVFTAGKALADQSGNDLAALAMGGDLTQCAGSLGTYPFQAMYLIQNRLLSTYHPDYFLSAFLQVHENIGPSVILMGHTAFSIDLAPRIALALNTGLIMDCTGCSCESGEFVFSKPVFSGHVIAALKILSRPSIATIRPKSFNLLPAAERDRAQEVRLDVSLDGVPLQYRVVERCDNKQEGPGVDDADVIVAGGRGIGGSEGFASLVRLAETLGAALGSSRPPVDMGWVPAYCQVGQTGSIVAPQVYFAIGISGSVQHVAGMAGSRTIIAVNSDAEASIFKIADFGVVARYEDVIPAFHRAIEHNRPASGAQ
jgi:electron transfer flavoprotein alpha subunit